MGEIPAAEVSIDARLVARLLNEQCPHLADPHVEAFAHGWDNELYALGPDLLVRLPRRAASAPLLDHELAALPQIAQMVATPVPRPVFAGRPTKYYPWRWSVVPRLPGRSAAEVPVSGRRAAAPGLAGFFAALHRPAPADAPANPFRGVPLSQKVDSWSPRIEAALGRDALALWRHWAAAPQWPEPPVWLHGDPHPMNLLLGADGTLDGVIDFGDVCSGDPASDLAVAWLMFDADARAEFRAACSFSGSYDGDIWARAWAWALGLAAVFSQASDDLPALARIAQHGLTETLADLEFGTGSPLVEPVETTDPSPTTEGTAS